VVRAGAAQVVPETAVSRSVRPLSDRVLLPGGFSGVIIAPLMPLAPGTKLGPYEVGVPLGAGGMGEVYRAKDTRLDRSVAIKILPAQFSADPVRKQRFEREAKTISTLNHPHICVLYDVGYQDGIDYLVMECVEGETLAKRLEKGQLPLEQVLKYGAQIADALDKAHRGGVVHRDLKPGNIVLAPGGAKLLDFGLAKPVSLPASGMTLTADTPRAAMTEEGMIVGTFQYMSPEQVEGKELDGRSDIFSLGAVLYEMVTGKKAFEGKSQFSVASAVLEKEPAPITSMKPLTPPGLEHAVKKCLAKDPDERWQSASDLKSELNWIVESGSHGGVSASVVTGRKKREGIAWAVAAAAAAALIVLLASDLRQVSLHPPVIISSVLLPPNTRFARWPKVSPDGRTLLLVLADAQGRSMLWLRPLDSPAAQSLAGTEDALRPFWSADGRAIGFFADGKLKTVGASGGHVTVLCDAPFPIGGSWNREGTILFVPELGAGIYQITASGGSPRLVIDLDKSKFSDYEYPEFLPDGRHFTYSASSADAASTGTYFASIDGRENRLVTQSTGNRVFSSGYLFFTQPTGSNADLMAVALDPASGNVKGDPKLAAQAIEYVTGPDEASFTVSDSTLIYEPGSTGATSLLTLAWLDRTGKRISTVTGGSNSSDLRLSADGQKVAYSKGDPNSDIWIQELKRDVPTRLTFDTSVDKGAPTWSPDGNDVLFDIALGGKTPPGIYRKSSSGTGAEELLAQPKEPDAMLWPTDWSRNGQFILCVQGEIIARNRGEIWVLPTSGDRKPRVFIRAPGAAYDGQFSPDGRWVAYVSMESGRHEVYVVPFDGNQVSNTPPHGQVAITRRWQVSANGGEFPRWRRDGKELFYVGPGDEFMSVRVEAKGGDFSLGEVRPLFRESLAAVASPYDVSPDGQRFLVNSLGQTGSSPLTVVVNWKELLKNK
jgi:eukaryotic-like serine/threonine-protein kinase